MSNCILSHCNFIHIPKCGGTAVNSALWRLRVIRSQDQVIKSPHYGHLFASQMPQNGNPFFSFVRHPVTWWLSFYHWNKNAEHSRFCKLEQETSSFDEWIKDYGQFWLGHYSVLVRRYLGEDSLFPTNNKVHLVGKIENLFSDLKSMFDQMKQPYDANVMLKLISGELRFDSRLSNTQDYVRGTVSDESKKIIYDCEQYMYNTFNYTL